MDKTRLLLLVLAWFFFLTAAAELAAIPFTSIGIAGFFAASFGVFWGGILLATVRALDDLRAIRRQLTPSGSSAPALPPTAG